MASANKVEVGNPGSYKACHNKQYEAWVCKPPAGTVVINKFVNPQVVKSLNGKDFFTVSELQELQQKNPQFFAQLQQAVQQGIAQCVKEDECVVSGTRGELRVENIQRLQAEFSCFTNGAWSSDWQSAVSGKVVAVNGSSCFNWVKAQYRMTTVHKMACFVPSSQKGQIPTRFGVRNYNAVGVDHGLGDFVVCSSVNGKPDLSSAEVVNGLIFADTFNNQGWTQCLKTSAVSASVAEPAKLFDVSPASNPFEKAFLSALKETLTKNYNMSLEIDKSRDTMSSRVGFYNIKARSGDNRGAKGHIMFEKLHNGVGYAISVGLIGDPQVRRIAIPKDNKSRFDGAVSNVALIIGNLAGVEAPDPVGLVIQAYAKEVNYTAHKEADNECIRWTIGQHSKSPVIEVYSPTPAGCDCRVGYAPGTVWVEWQYKASTPKSEAIAQLKSKLAEAKKLMKEDAGKFLQNVRSVVKYVEDRYGVKYTEDYVDLYQCQFTNKQYGMNIQANRKDEVIIFHIDAGDITSCEFDRLFRFDQNEIYGWDEVEQRVSAAVGTAKFCTICNEFSKLTGFKVEGRSTKSEEDDEDFVVSVFTHVDIKTVEDFNKQDRAREFAWTIMLNPELKSTMKYSITAGVPEMCSVGSLLFKDSVDECAKQLKERFELADPKADRAGRPLTDIASDFDIIFRKLISINGYKLARYIGVERHYDKNSQKQKDDKQAGFVPLKYQIDGDNDDILVIDVKFERNKANGQLKISYRGQSQGVKVNEQAPVSMDVEHMTGIEMTELADRVLQTFVVRLNLAPASRFNKLMEYMTKRYGYKISEIPKEQLESFIPGAIRGYNVDGAYYNGQVKVGVMSVSNSGEAECYVFCGFASKFTVNLKDSIIKTAPIFDEKIKSGASSAESKYWEVH